jgi:hypothetical protein
VLDYVRFQLVATPMTMLLKDKTEPERAERCDAHEPDAASDGRLYDRAR